MHREHREGSPGETSRRPQPASVPAGRRDVQLLRLQRTIGNRAAAQLLARNGEGKVNLANMGSWHGLSERDRWIADFQFIQRCMMEEALYGPPLLRLAEAVAKERQVGESKIDDGPLDRVLLAMERRHGINLGGAPTYTRTLSAGVFTQMSRRAVVATDPGAGANHGAYTHRIQWYVVLCYADRLEHAAADLVVEALNPAFTPPKENWPLKGRVTVNGTTEEQDILENRGTMWDALFDRTIFQMFTGLFTVSALGISHPEVFTQAIRAGRFGERFEPVARIIRAQVDARWGGAGSGPEAERVEAALGLRGYVAELPGVYTRPPVPGAGGAPAPAVPPPVAPGGVMPGM